MELISSVNQLCCWLEAVMPGQLSVQACHSHRKRGEVTLQSATDGQSNLLLLTLTQDTTEATMPIATNMLSLAVSKLKHTLKNHTHSETCKCTRAQNSHSRPRYSSRTSHILSFSSLAMMTGSSMPSSECHCKHTDGKTEGGETPENYC